MNNMVILPGATLSVKVSRHVSLSQIFSNITVLLITMALLVCGRLELDMALVLCCTLVECFHALSPSRLGTR